MAATATFDRPVRDGAVVLAQRDGRLVDRLRPLWRAYTAYFRSEVRRLDRVPQSKPVLLVGNHSGGLFMPDVAALLLAWTDRFGADRPLYVLGSDIPQSVPGLGAALRTLGIVPADPVTGATALESGADVLVYPGGDLDDCRAWRDRHRIEFGHHLGFVRLALQRRVPIVPVVTHGSHESVIILTRGDQLARALHLERFRIKVLPFVLGVPFGVAPIVVPHVPLPAKVTVEVLDPIDWHLGDGAADDPATLERCYAEVVDVMQGALDRLAAVPALPWLDTPPHR